MTLEQFQAHKQLGIVFSPTITTIRGPTDRGKSAILRALRWVCLNDLSGEEFIREGSKTTTVTLQVTDHEIIRSKTRGGNSNTYEMDGDVFRSFATSVPSKIEAAFQLSLINFQAQFDSPFWFAETAGEVSRQLNSVIDLSVIDTSLSNISTTVRRAEERHSLSEDRWAEAKKEKEELEPQAARVEEFQALLRSRGKLLEQKDQSETLTNLLTELRIRNEQIQTSSEKAEDGTATLAFGREAIKAGRRAEALASILRDLDRVSADCQSPPPFAPVAEAWASWQEEVAQLDCLRDWIARYEGIQAKVGKLEQLAQSKEREFHQKMKGQKCPLCGNMLRT